MMGINAHAAIIMADAGGSAAEATILGALIAGATALLAAIITVAIQRYSLSRSEFFALRQHSLERTERQIDELYGPLLMMRRQSNYLWSRLREGKEDPDWRLLNHIEEVKKNPSERAIVQELVRLNELSQMLILGHPALIYQHILPESFHKFLAHAGLVKVAFEQGEVPGDGTFIYYPDEFDKDLEETYGKLVELRVNELGMNS